VIAKRARISARTVAGVVALAATLTSSFAFATDTAAAQALFSDARKLMNAGNFADACPKLEESENLDPGMGTLYNLGDCYEHVGKTASAWAAFDEVASEAKAAQQPAREQDARARSAALVGSLSHMTIDASAIKMLPGVEVSRDGTSVGTPQWGLSIPVDPGEHTVVALATGKKTWTTKITIAAREAKLVTLPALEDAPVAQSRGLADYPKDRPTNDGKTQRTIGLIVAGVGVVALATGVVFTLVSKNQESKSNDNDCDPNTNFCKTSNGVSERSSAIADGNISTVGFIAGLILAGGGITLWATAPKAHAQPQSGKWSVTPDVAFGQNGASFGMHGRW
jgi:hypothetical protein